jgi:hypothetical protein
MARADFLGMDGVHRLYSIAIHSKKAPIILVGTHKEDPRLSEDHLKKLSEGLKEKFSRAFRNIRATVFVDTASGHVRSILLLIIIINS